MPRKKTIEEVRAKFPTMKDPRDYKARNHKTTFVCPKCKGDYPARPSSWLRGEVQSCPPCSGRRFRVPPFPAKIVALLKSMPVAPVPTFVRWAAVAAPVTKS